MNEVALYALLRTLPEWASVSIGEFTTEFVPWACERLRMILGIPRENIALPSPAVYVRESSSGPSGHHAVDAVLSSVVFPRRGVAIAASRYAQLQNASAADLSESDAAIASYHEVSLSLRHYLKGTVEKWSKDSKSHLVPLGLVLSPTEICVARGGLGSSATRNLKVDTLTLKGASELLERIERVLNSELTGDPNRWGLLSETKRQSVDSDVRDYLRECFRRVYAVDSSSEKGAALEDLVEALISAHQGLEVRHRNIRGVSVEHDLVVRAKPTASGPLFSHFPGYVLVECKNWSRPATSKVLRDFAFKMTQCDVRIGIYCSKKGVTGKGNQSAARKVVSDYWSTQQRAILVVDGKELKLAIENLNLEGVLLRKLEALRFGA